MEPNPLMAAAFLPRYEYPARLYALHDGDTFRATIDLGFHIETIARVRLAGLDCPELGSDAGKAAAAYTAAWLHAAVGAWPLWIVSHKLDNYGRPLAQVFRQGDGACLNADLLASGHATVYPNHLP